MTTLAVLYLDKQHVLKTYTYAYTALAPLTGLSVVGALQTLMRTIVLFALQYAVLSKAQFEYLLLDSYRSGKGGLSYIL
jgi:hypothetical protein